MNLAREIALNMKMNSSALPLPLPASAARHTGRCPVHLHRLPAPRWALAAALALGTLGSAQAQTLIRSADLYIGMIGSATNNAVQLNTHAGDVLKVNYETDFNAGFGNTCWESVAWVSVSGSRVSAAMAGMNEFLEPVENRGLTINNLTLWNVDLDMGNVQLHFVPPTASPNAGIALTLNNGSLGGGLRTPLLWNPSPFQFNVTGDSQIGGWNGALRSVTTLDVASGGTLRIKDCGDVNGTTLDQKLYFSELNNNAIINGGSLIIDDSAVVFGRDPHSLDANQSTMTFTDNASLQITGLNTTPKLETDRLVFQNSSLNLAPNTYLKARSFLEFDNSTATIGDGAVADALQVIVKGASTANLTRHAGGGAGYSSIVTSFLDVRDGATFTLAGAGDMNVTGAARLPLTTGFGAIRVTQNANLWLHDANITLNSHNSLTTERTATTEAAVTLSDYAVMALYHDGTFVNQGTFTIAGDSTLNVIGHATIGGTGLMDMDAWVGFASGVPSQRGKSSLTTDNDIFFGLNSTLSMTLDPTGLTSDQIICGGLLSISPVANLDLQVINDTLLAEGVKFALVDYRGLQGALGSVSHFNGYDQGTIFNLGLNTYEIDYLDGDYLAGSASFITLTTVPEPSAAAILFGGALLLGLARRQGRRN